MTTAAPRPPARRKSVTSNSPTPSSPSIIRGATARSAVSRPGSTNATTARRPTTKPPTPSQGASDEINEVLTASLKLEIDQKEQLLVQLQTRDQTISGLTLENSNLNSALSAAEQRVNVLYTDQARSEAELANRIEIADKLRTQVRELEKEKRDLQRRYNGQMSTFEAERQAFYDNEQHLKSRIQSLMHSKKQPDLALINEPESESEAEAEAEDEDNVDFESVHPPAPLQRLQDPDSEPAEITALRLELSTLSTSYSSLQSTLVLLQSQLVDLKRVNNELQEENESYMILLREKTLSGQFDVMRHIGPSSSDEDDEDDVDNNDVGSLRSNGRNTLDRVPEEPSEGTLENEVLNDFHAEDRDSTSIASRPPGRPNRKRTTSTSSTHRGGESLAGLPLTGPGLDLAAELGRAENKDTPDSVMEDQQPKGKRGRRNTETRKMSASESGIDASASLTDIDALQKEVKSLKDANKALSLYASKIIDRIISQEGFEHVLAADYEKTHSPPTPVATKPQSESAFSRVRPQSIIVNRALSNPTEPPRVISPPSQPNPKAQRRSLSFDWRGFSLFNSSEKKTEPASLRPLTLKPGSSPIVSGGRKLETEEDEEDQRERERLAATMKLMGIQPSTSPSVSTPKFAPPASVPNTPLASVARRFSLFGSRCTTEDNAARSTPIVDSHTNANGNAHIGLGVSTDLTTEALEHAEAENSLAALDANERTLSANIAGGAGGGFTEIQSRRSISGRRSRISRDSGSGSTVWSAGLSDNGREEPTSNSNNPDHTL